MVVNSAMDTKSLSRVEHVERVDYGRKSKGLWLAGPRQKCRGRVFVHVGMAGYVVFQTVEIRSGLFSNAGNFKNVNFIIDNHRKVLIQFKP